MILTLLSGAIRSHAQHTPRLRSLALSETPILSSNAGGASATPFETRSVALGSAAPSLFMRIAPELYLKQAIVGGFARVYEIGKQFRNEGIDKRHSPEFTTLELYQVGATIDDHMRLTELMIERLLRRVLDKPTLTVGDLNFAVTSLCRTTTPHRPPTDRLCRHRLRAFLLSTSSRVRCSCVIAPLCWRLMWTSSPIWCSSAASRSTTTRAKR